MNQPHPKSNHMYDLCKKHMHTYVLAETVDGNKVDGIITGVDEQYVYLAVPNTGYQFEGHGVSRGGPAYGPGFGYPGYGYGYPGYGHPSRFNRLVLPLTALVGLSALPWY
ncbi:hypothetical protein NC797_17510 [Aquibacillus sp. 3ASR75-11]|uniref:Uncharacterized protein n=1 Tax=Terrihalobacillus insolitus TaxID=2950438 RepID=A0A9X3WUS0_9BACI|nr:hypothetical protein [Terrihalobacillus insolitus]MDC3413700.1 hypothetical protein [Terrihalobacillus insolitus]MDC3426282.1 hypothetical protein [Terrihalobacillus insolitus]